MTEVDIKEIMTQQMNLAIEQRRGQKEADDFKVQIKIVGPGGSVADVPLQWGSDHDKKLKMAVLSHLCERVSAVAAIVTSDTRRLDSKAFCKYFNLQYSDSKAFLKDYHRIMADYNFEMGRLPRETWKDALHVIAYGPRIKKMMMSRYTMGADGFVFEPAQLAEESDTIEVGLIPAWWT